MLLVVSVVIAAIVTSGLAGGVVDSVQGAICRIGGSCESGEGQAADDPGERLAKIAARERVLTPFTSNHPAFRDLLTQARAARERGDLAGAERLLDRLELYRRLSADDRGDLLEETSGLSDADFDALAAQDTIDNPDGSNQRSFRIPASPGDGVIVMDYFIPGDASGPLKGDDRGTEDPLLGPHEPDRSRVIVVLDRETGRAVIHQSPTCTAFSLPGSGPYCERPRPIALREPRTRPQANPLPGPQAPNEFHVDADGDSIELSYDALNSITPIGLSVDGTVRLERGGDGFMRVTSDTRDPYPRIVTGQYRPGASPRIIDETEDRPVLEGAPPEPVRDVIEGAGEVKDFACDLPVGPLGPLGPLGPVGQELVC